MSRYSLNARKVFVVQKHTGASLGTIGEAVKDKIVGTGNSEFVDLSFGVIKSDPKTGNVLKASLVPLAQEANNSITEAFSAVSDFLSRPSELPQAAVNRGGAFRISLGFSNFTTSPWPGLSKSYTDKIARGILTKRRKKSKKKFWYERGAWNKPPTNSSKGGSGEPLHKLLKSSGFSRQVLKATNGNVMSLYGSSRSVTFQTTGLRPAKSKPYTRSTKRGKISVGGLRGTILLPTSFGQITGDAIEELYELLYGSLATGKHKDNEHHSLSELGMTSSEHPDFTQLLLANEYRRPFLSKAFAGLAKEVERRMRAEALRLS